MKLSRPRCLSLRYSTKRHDMDRRVARPDPDDDLFDDEVERDLVGDTDFDDDGLVTYEEFRASVRERVARGQPSPYAPMRARAPSRPRRG